MGDGSVDMTQASAAVLFDVNNREVLYSKNAHERLYPASLTKVMTALVALKNASLDTVLTATDSVKINESGAQLCGLKSGDTMTLDQALHILLMLLISFLLKNRIIINLEVCLCSFHNHYMFHILIELQIL